MKIKSLCIIVLMVLTSSILQCQNIKFDWAISEGGMNLDEGNSILSDSVGNIYVVGNFHKTMDFDPGSNYYSLTSNGIYDLFVQKLDASGNLIWAKSMGGAGSEICHSAALDNDGNVYVTGFFRDSADFDPGPGKSMLYTNGLNDIFVLKLDTLGNFCWAVSMGGALYDEGKSIHIDKFGNVYTVGIFQTTSVDFDPGSGYRILHGKGGTDVFIQKLDSSGSFLWAKSIGSSYFENATSVTTDLEGNVLLTGRYAFTVDFDPGSGTQNLSSVSDSEDIYILKLDASGNYVWVQSFGSDDFDEGTNITTDNSGNLYVSGNFQGTVDFDSGVQVANLNSNGNRTDVFLLKMKSSGDYIWAVSNSGSDYELNNSIAVNDLGNIYLTGQYKGTVDFDPGNGVSNLSAIGDYDIYIQVLDSFGNLISAKSIGAWQEDIGKSILVDNNDNIYVAGHYKSSNVDFDPDTSSLIMSPKGFSDVFVLKFEQCYPTTSTISIDTCDSYTWPLDGKTYSKSGKYSTTLINWKNCDSIISLNLTINNNVGSQTISACNSYTWPADSNVYTSSGTYTATIKNYAGCDSVITLHLTITKINKTVNESGKTLTVVETGATYQWLDCTNGYTIIAGETNKSFTPTETGKYAVEISKNNCTDTSSCFDIVVNGIKNNSFQNNIRVYPNPSYGKFILDLGIEYEWLNVTISDLSGKIIQEHIFKHQQLLNLELKNAEGIYIVKIESPVSLFFVRLYMY